MKQVYLVLGVIAAVLLLGGCWVISARNELIRLEEDVKNADSNIDTSLQRRNDLIPNLVNTVQGYASHEETVFTNIANARSKLAGARTPAEKAEADAELSSALSRLLVIAEAYPELKANENFRDLQAQLEGTENRIKIARDKYNDTVKTYNTRIRQFPGSMFAGSLGLKERPYFEPPQGRAAVEKAPEVNFNTGSNANNGGNNNANNGGNANANNGGNAN